MTKEQAYKLWNEWLEKCPIYYRVLNCPTVDIEQISFDFDEYKGEKND